MGWETARARHDDLTPGREPYTRGTYTPHLPALSSMTLQSSVRVEKKSLGLDDEVQFIRSWFEKPLATGAVMPSGRVLARTMASYVDPKIQGPVVELGPGTGPVTEALVAR